MQDEEANLRARLGHRIWVVSGWGKGDKRTYIDELIMTFFFLMFKGYWEDHNLCVRMKNRNGRMKARACEKESWPRATAKPRGNRLTVQQVRFKLDSGKKCPGGCQIQQQAVQSSPSGVTFKKPRGWHAPPFRLPHSVPTVPFYPPPCCVLGINNGVIHS